MKKSQREPFVKIDEFEDLTLFANESFDTQDVDLFEFSSEESSPLTRLKSIILSLDWEINDDILQELADELETLQAMWTDDKVAEVYLQGLSKLGGYLRARGAYAHPNSIKLLLTFFYNFEKIISSQNISGEEISNLLKGDVRKFRILQYQINQSELESSPPVVEPTEVPASLHPQESGLRETDHAKQLKAAILSLDWEVTDDSLKQFNTKLYRFHGEVAGNKGALVLIQGLQALGDYIAEERANAHPEAFILLHSFNDALEQVAQLTPERLGPEEIERIENILVEQINRLNNLKMLIAAPVQSSVDEQHINEVVGQISTPAVMADIDQEPAAALHEDQRPQPTYLSEDFAIAMDQEATDDSMDSTMEAELDTLFTLDTKPAMESAEVQYPDELLPPDAIHPVDDDLADDFIEAQLSDRRGLQPALSDTDELAGYSEDAEPLDLPAQSDLAEQLDFLFSDVEDDITAEEAPLSPLDIDAQETSSIEDAEPVAALAAFEPERLDQNEPFSTADALTGENYEVLAALADSEWPPDTPDRHAEADDSDQAFLDIQNKLDVFFADTPKEPSEPNVSAADDVEEVEQALFFTEENGVESALADSTEERGFSEEEAIATLDNTPLDEIEEKLDFFFGSETDEQPDTEEVADNLTMATAAMEDSVAFQDDVPALFTDDIREKEAVATAINDDAPPALANVDDLLMEEVAEAPGLDELDRELEGKLDLFFGADEDPIASEEPVEEPVDALTRALEAAFDDEQPVTVDLSEDELAHPAAATEEDKQIHLATLGALLPGIVRAASREQAAESTRLIEAVNTTGLSAEHRSLLQMLDSVIGLLARLPVQDGADTEKLVNYLYEQLLEKECRPEVLTTAVLRFTAWLQQASALMPLVPAAAEDKGHEPHFAYTAKELYFELAELRAHIKDEFAKLRHEMHHHKS